jgi:hypothetical protein
VPLVRQAFEQHLVIRLCPEPDGLMIMKCHP